MFRQGAGDRLRGAVKQAAPPPVATPPATIDLDLPASLTRLTLTSSDAPSSPTALLSSFLKL
jgi:hypothetical protein